MVGRLERCGATNAFRIELATMIPRAASVGSSLRH